jgi:hypothetical protein
MECLDAPGSEGQCLALRCRHLCRCCPPLGIGQAQVRELGSGPIELPRVVDDRRIAAGAHVGDDIGHDAIDVLVGVSVAPQEGRKVLFEARRRGVEPFRRHERSRGSDRPSGRSAPAASSARRD